jgi:hypothetical protein
MATFENGYPLYAGAIYFVLCSKWESPAPIKSHSHSVSRSMAMAFVIHTLPLALCDCTYLLTTLPAAVRRPLKLAALELPQF